MNVSPAVGGIPSYVDALDSLLAAPQAMLKAPSQLQPPSHPRSSPHHHHPPAALVHCGAGVSRSAALVMMMLMRRNGWSAARALKVVKAVRSIVQPNDGFWRTLCRLEESLGIPINERCACRRWGSGWCVEGLGASGVGRQHNLMTVVVCGCPPLLIPPSPLHQTGVTSTPPLALPAMMHCPVR